MREKEKVIVEMITDGNLYMDNVFHFNYNNSQGKKEVRRCSMKLFLLSVIVLLLSSAACRKPEPVQIDYFPTIPMTNMKLVCDDLEAHCSQYFYKDLCLKHLGEFCEEARAKSPSPEVF